MLARNGAGPALCDDRGEAGVGSKFAGKQDLLNSRPLQNPQPLRAELTGADTGTAAGITATGHTPVLGLCRKLIAAGVDPDLPLEAFRGPVLALRIRSIGEAAQLTARESSRDGRPRLVRLSGDGRPPMRQIEKSVVRGRP